MTEPRVVIIGGGMSGIGMAVKLQDAGVCDAVILEKGEEYGGTWRENTYPGLACDVPAPFYTYTFAPNPGWTHRFASGAEIHRYLCGVADRYGLRARTRFGAEVTACTWEDGAWTVEIAGGGSLRADVVVAATGVLHRPRVPDIPGRDTFSGPAFHSARWDHDVPLDGARIGVIGTGSTGVQLVTELGDRGHEVVQFQRTPQWVLPLPNTSYSPLLRRAQRRWPAISRGLYRYHQIMLEGFFEGIVTPGWKRRTAQAACRAALHRVRDPELRARLTPTDEPMCKRLILSAGYHRVVQLPNVEVVSGGIDRIEPTGVVTDDGRLHELDVLVFATGFDAQAFLRPIDVRGEDGLTLAELWRDGPRAHQTIGLPGFPNLFLLLGPNSPIGNTSLFPISEAQAEVVLRLIERIRGGETALAPTREATDAFNRRLRAGMADTVWVTGCDSWYLGPDGTPILWPEAPRRFYEMLAEVPGDDWVPARAFADAQPASL